MRGTLHIIPPEPDATHRLVALSRPVTLEELQAAVGGHLEIIPGFDSILRDGQIRSCVAFCNEEGKLQELPVNHWANTLWIQSLARRHGIGHSDPGDVLVGPVALVTGDAAFMAEL